MKHLISCRVFRKQSDLFAATPRPLPRILFHVEITFCASLFASSGKDPEIGNDLKIHIKDAYYSHHHMYTYTYVYIWMAS